MAEAALSREPDFGWWMTNTKGYRETTQLEYSRRIKRCSIDLRTAEIQEIRKHFFSTHPSPTSRNRERQALIAYLDYLVDLGVRSDNPAKQLPRLKEPEGLPNPIPRDKVEPLLDKAKSYSPFFGTIVTVFLYTGLRLTEVCRLRRDQLHGEWAYLEQKGGQVRAVYLPEAVQEALKLHGGSSEWVFPSPRNTGPIGRNWVWRKIRDFGLDIDLKECRPHRLRHYFGTTVWEQTRDLAVTQQALGHKNIGNTVRYTRVRPIHVKEAVERLKLF